MKQSLKKRLEKLEENSYTASQRRKTALILCDSDLPTDFNYFDVDADAVLIAPDNGHRGPSKKAPKGSYSVYYIS
ncbi:MAG: hypothetical protein JSR85_08215 [Proteobacteria bacterium]|nr:hypothetical protein [Pseudomonadota bacterium]